MEGFRQQQERSCRKANGESEKNRTSPSLPPSPTNLWLWRLTLCWAWDPPLLFPAFLISLLLLPASSSLPLLPIPPLSLSLSLSLSRNRRELFNVCTLAYANNTTYSYMFGGYWIPSINPLKKKNEKEKEIKSKKEISKRTHHQW
uniref:Uncharacterized protein n=1 Tax=Opuntia streptacantha TaxID=393608 RepID=A0A7C9CTD3_OPUST